MIDLNDYFERVQVINLDRFPERISRLGYHLMDREVKGVERFKAVDAKVCKSPSWFKAGSPAWCCLMSHLRIVQDAAMDGLANYFVLEDDVVFSEDFSERLPKIMAEVGDDWDMIYFGGQHLCENGNPRRVDGKSEVIQPFNVNRTHAFAVNSRFYAQFGRHIMSAPSYIKREKGWHIDHQLGVLHEGAMNGASPFKKLKIYAVHPWVAAQSGGRSGISANRFPEKWFHIDKDKIKEPK